MLDAGKAFLIDCRIPQIYRTSETQWDFVWVHFTAQMVESYIETLIKIYGPVFSCQLEDTIGQEILGMHHAFQGHNLLRDHPAYCSLIQILTKLYSYQKQMQNRIQVSRRYEASADIY